MGNSRGRSQVRVAGMYLRGRVAKSYGAVVVPDPDTLAPGIALVRRAS